jgi:hypothetical protein
MNPATYGRWERGVGGLGCSRRALVIVQSVTIDQVGNR